LLYLNHKEDIIATGKDTLSGNTVSDIGDTDITVTAIIRDVAAISQTPTSTVVCQGDTVTIYVTVKNLGNVSETFNVTCYYDSNQIGVLRVYNLEPGNQTIIPFEWDTTGVTPGTYSVRAKADSSDEIAESNETNNICTSPSTVKIVIHDIAIISQVPSPTTVVQGGIVTIQVVVKNEGTEPETFNVSCYYNETLLEIKTVTNLQPSTTLTLNFLWNTAGVPAGTYFINTVASTVPGEKDTNDNACRSVNMVTITLPQYQITFRQTGVGSDFTNTVVVVDGSNYKVTDLPKTFTWVAGSVHTFAFKSPLVVTPNAKRYVWISTSGLSTLQNGSITVSSSGNVTGNYKTQYYLTVSSPYDSPTPTSGWFDSGTPITASVTSPWSGPTGTRYVCTGWTGTGSVPAFGTATTATFTINQVSSITWKWKTQYLLTVRTDPTGLSPQPTRNPAGEAGSGGWWYDNSTSVQLTAETVAGYDFLNWDVDTTPVSGNPITVLMNNPHTATAHYKVSAPPTPPSVGGYAHPITLDLGTSNSLIPQVGLASALSAIVTATIILVRRRKYTLKREH